MAHLPRGIDPTLLVSQVKNTMPYLFAEYGEQIAAAHFLPAQVIRAEHESASLELSHFEYFRLCLSAHYLTCGTPVPTDVDNQIRFKLWPATLPLEVALEMARLVLESHRWDFTRVSSRFNFGAEGTKWQSEPLSGHLGEWFTVSAAAYCALKRYPVPEALAIRREIFEEIESEVNRHSEIFGSLWRAKDGLLSLKASASIAHNFGDLDRVMDMWDLGVDDPLRLRFYKLTASPLDSEGQLRYLGRLWVAGELYKSVLVGGSMAFENHRHFALRKPRCLRQSPSFLIPTGPFFDDWGTRVAQGLSASGGSPSEQTYEVVEALQLGWQRLPKTVGYGRALRGMLAVHPQLDLDEIIKSHAGRSAIEMSQASFERKWSEAALQEMDEIPSRA